MRARPELARRTRGARAAPALTTAAPLLAAAEVLRLGPDVLRFLARARPGLRQPAAGALAPLLEQLLGALDLGAISVGGALTALLGHDDDRDRLPDPEPRPLPPVERRAVDRDRELDLDLDPEPEPEPSELPVTRVAPDWTPRAVPRASEAAASPALRIPASP